ncbi:hypothetical protein ACN083_05895 [Rothia sp. CCM 9418]|uniref:hypothetical protein n=1 Tax=Rothia sp. CCM 9418 TaxID=3402661 RepID=UPI003AE59ACE
MKISSMLLEKKRETGMSWTQIGKLHGGEKRLYRLANDKITSLPSIPTIKHCSDFLGIPPIKVILAVAEELGLYSQEKDGRLINMPTETLHRAHLMLDELGAYLDA